MIHRKFIGTVHADNHIIQYRTSEVTLCHAAFSTRFARLLQYAIVELYLCIYNRAETVPLKISKIGY